MHYDQIDWFLECFVMTSDRPRANDRAISHDYHKVALKSLTPLRKKTKAK